MKKKIKKCKKVDVLLVIWADVYSVNKNNYCLPFILSTN